MQQELNHIYITIKLPIRLRTTLVPKPEDSCLKRILLFSPVETTLSGPACKRLSP